MFLTNNPPVKKVNSVEEVYVQDSGYSSIIVTGAGDESQQAYWERPNKTIELDLITGKNTGVRLKSILFWNGIFYHPDFAFGRGRQPFIEAKCKVDTCLVTDDPYLFGSIGKSIQSNSTIFKVKTDKRNNKTKWWMEGSCNSASYTKVKFSSSDANLKP